MIKVLFHGNAYNDAALCPYCHAILEYTEKDVIREEPDKVDPPWWRSIGHHKVVPYIVCPECRHKIKFDTKNNFC